MLEEVKDVIVIFAYLSIQLCVCVFYVLGRLHNKRKKQLINPIITRMFISSFIIRTLYSISCNTHITEEENAYYCNHG